MTTLYNEAIEQIKLAAYEIGANCILGLRIDMDEISGKGKSMFMLTAIGTAVVLDKEKSGPDVVDITPQKFENISVHKIATLPIKKSIIKEAETDKLVPDDETWGFITSNQVDEVFPYILKEYSEITRYEQSAPLHQKLFINNY